ncbi:MAG: HAMP domain-containing histidine kinase [Betaproteobacteria bacterium]|jgi:two-component system sensor histidine kinase RegB|uniref:ATP-binding protein n=1 Tax=Thiomonas TaxID=32012 RepID=UPI00239E737C|nr:MULTISPECIES: ATP-binding protein [Thiomonas]MDE2176073.1 HAMP domain-containing histidine kinase [Betaproteobacteria bacterium]HML80747.1 ATP-binding protein [Thiomonas arsenitoxydans]
MPLSSRIPRLPLADQGAQASLSASPHLPAVTLTRLLAARVAMLLAELAVLPWAHHFLDITWPVYKVLGLIGLQAALGVLLWWQIRSRRGLGAFGGFVHLLADALILALLVYWSGGEVNPIISLLLIPLVLSAVALPWFYVWAMTAVVITLYSLVSFFPTPLTEACGVATGMLGEHLTGMWGNFLITALLVAAVVARLASALREREIELARSREVGLRDQHLFALGMQAAAAAHELATPVSTLAMTVDDLQADYAGDDELGPQLQRMQAQVAQIRTVLGHITAAAGAARSRSDQTETLAHWLEQTLEHWHLMRPQSQAGLALRSAGSPPVLRVDAGLNAALVSLLNNAADASPDAVEVEADWDATSLRVHVLDRGPGLSDDRLARAGYDFVSTKGETRGLGLALARAGIERLGGTLTVARRAGGGLSATLQWPRLDPTQ